MILKRIVYGTVTSFDLIISALILIFAILVKKALSIYLRRLFKEKVSKDHLEIILKVINYSVMAIALIIVLPILGVQLSGLLVAGGIVGIAIAFASQSVIGNLISGLFLIIERPIRIGDTVNIEGNIGIVEDIRIMSISIRTFEGIYVRIPNQKVFTANITNYVANVVRRFQYVVGIRYSDDADKAIQIIKEICENHPMALINPEPDVFVDNLGDNSVNIIVRIWTPATEWYEIKKKLLWVIKDSLEKQGIEIAFPQRVIWFAKKPD